jgi:Cu/Ag efflux protein CusF
MKSIRFIILFLFLFNILFAKSWEIIPDRKVVYSTNSGVKLKAIAGISDENKKLCFLVKRKDDGKFYYAGTLYIQFANGYEKLGSYSGGKTTDKVGVCVKFDINNMAGYPNFPYNYFSQGKVKVWVKSDNGDVFNFPDFYLKAVNPIKINNYSIEKIDETDNYEKFKMTFSLSQIPTVIKIETDGAENPYYFVKNGYIKSKPSFVDSWQYSSDKKNWTVYFHIYKKDYIQNKWFKLIVQDYRAKSANELVDYKTEYFSVNKKENKKYTLNVKVDSTSKQLPAEFEFNVKTNYKVDGLKVVTSDAESNIRYRDGFGTFGAIQIKPIDNFTWKVTYKIDDIGNLSKKNITLQFYAIDKNSNELAKNYINIEVFKNNDNNNNENLEKIITFLNQSVVLKKLNLGDKTIRYSHLSRAEAALILYEFLKLKNPDFKLPYEDPNLYNNPFADIDQNSDYYKAVITLANYKGSDNETVLTKKFGVFNPLENVLRFQFVKMIVEGLNLEKTHDFSNIQNFDDYSKLKNDAKIYYATAVKYGLIKGDNNKLLPYDKLTIFQALTILQRAQDFALNVNATQFEEPDFNNDKIGNPLGFIPEIQNYDPNVAPIKINNIITQKEGNCTKLSVVAKVDPKANATYIWSANFGFFKSLSDDNKNVLFCPSSKKPSVDYNITVTAWDNYMNSDTFSKILSKNDFTYVKNIADNYKNEVDFNVSLNLKNNIMKENSIFIINKNGSLYKNNVNIGLEKVTVTLQNKDGDTYTIDNVKWDDNSIYFYVPSVKKFYGKYIMVKVYYGSNDTYKTKTFEKVLYKPQFIINGEVDPDKNGNYPKYIKINSHQINIENGKFIYIAPDKGNYQISVNKNYQTKSITLTDENPTAYIYLNYIDLDYDNDGVENDKDAFPYDPAASVDSDGDGHPDKWNDGYTQADSTTGLILDKYPNDPNKWSDNSQPICPQIITHAYNPVTGEEKDYPTPCDVPNGWIKGTPPDSDGDGVNDIKDAFPYDPAASVDSDGDGYPDKWNDGYTQADIMSSKKRTKK